MKRKRRRVSSGGGVRTGLEEGADRVAETKCEELLPHVDAILLLRCHPPPLAVSNVTSTEEVGGCTGEALGDRCALNEAQHGDAHGGGEHISQP
jgi:hypothetical protein